MWMAFGTHHTGSCPLSHLEKVSRGSSRGEGETTGAGVCLPKEGITIPLMRPGCCGPGPRKRLEHAKGSQWLQHLEAVPVLWLGLLREAAFGGHWTGVAEGGKSGQGRGHTTETPNNLPLGAADE